MAVAQAAVDRQFQFLRLYGRHISADITRMTGRKAGSESLVVRVGLGWQAISGLMGPDSRRRAADAARHGCVAPRLAVVGPLDRRRTYVGPGPRATRGQDGSTSRHGGRSRLRDPFEEAAEQLARHRHLRHLEEDQREHSRATILKLAHSLPAEEPLRRTFLSAPFVCRVLGDR